MERTIASLMNEIDAGELALPEFQRDYKWPVENIEELLRSVGQDFPIGTFLLLSQDAKLRLQASAIRGARKPKAKPNHLLLDGQQRLTALYQAFNEIGDYIYYVDLNIIQGERLFVDECVGSVHRDRLVSELGGLQERRRRRILTLPEAYHDAQFQAWVSSPEFSTTEQTRLSSMRQKYLAPFREHTVTCEVVPGRLPVAAIAKVFERTNRRVLRLDAFDLMVAVMWPHGFKLRSEWENALKTYPILDSWNIRGLEILRLIALREHSRGAPKVAGIRQSDILEVAPAVIKREWASAVKAFARALEFSRDECGVLRKNLMPNVTMWVPLADVLWGSTAKRGSPRYSKIVRWFWAACFTRQYARGANTKAVSDAEWLRAWLQRQRKDPTEYVKRFRVDSSDFDAVPDEGNDVLVRAVICFLNTQGARDWATGHGKSPPPKLAELQSTSLAIHHVYPKKFLDQRKRDGHPDAAANQVLISSTLNGQLNNQPPEYAATSRLVDKRALRSHAVDTADLRRQYSRFLANRSKALATLINQAMP